MYLSAHAKQFAFAQLQKILGRPRTTNKTLRHLSPPDQGPIRSDRQTSTGQFLTGSGGQVLSLKHQRTGAATIIDKCGWRPGHAKAEQLPRNRRTLRLGRLGLCRRRRTRVKGLKTLTKRLHIARAGRYREAKAVDIGRRVFGMGYDTPDQHCRQANRRRRKTHAPPSH